MFPRLAHVHAFLAGAVLALLAACAARPEAPPPSRETRVLRVGTSGDHPPFSTLRDGQASGFDAALMESYASARGYRLEWVRFRLCSPWQRARGSAWVTLAQPGIEPPLATP